MLQQGPPLRLPPGLRRGVASGISWGASSRPCFGLLKDVVQGTRASATRGSPLWVTLRLSFDARALKIRQLPGGRLTRYKNESPNDSILPGHLKSFSNSARPMAFNVCTDA
jgi:hypothetical protein